MSRIDPDHIENILIYMLYRNEVVREKIMPYLNSSIIENDHNKKIIKHFTEFYNGYNKYPTFKDSELYFIEKDLISQKLKIVQDIEIEDYTNESLLDELEEYFKEKMVFNICFDTVKTLQEDGVGSVQGISDHLADALNFTFKAKTATDIFENPDIMWNYYHEKHNYIPTNINQLNECLGGGLFSETLTLFLAESNMGKTLIMTSLAANNILNDKVVLFVTCEMTKEEISSRILTNCFKMSRKEIESLSKDRFCELFRRISNTYKGKMFVEHFPAKTISPLDLKLYVKRFILQHGKAPDILYFDQLCSFIPSKHNKMESSHTERETITLEFRAIGQIYKIPLVSVIQATRDGYKRSELDLTHTADSLGYIKHADFVVAVTQPEECKSQNKFLWELLKSRNSTKNVKFTVAVNFALMNVEDDADSKLRLRNRDLLPEDRVKIKTTEVEELSNMVRINKSKERLDF